MVGTKYQAIDLIASATIKIRWHYVNKKMAWWYVT